MSVRVRFAPSPTGALHIGGVRTALFNWLYAKRFGGKFLLRIEDTDTERSLPEHTQDILACMKWLGLTWDEELVYQSQRLDRHRAVAEELVKKGRAYYCYCTEAEVEDMRHAAISRGEKPMYDRRCRLGNGPSPDGRTRVIRVRIPLEGSVEFDDLIHGPIKFENKDIDDFVIVRTNGAPTYNHSVVCDDMDMRVTHVVRGDDHINNTPKQVHLYDFMEYPVPKFAHLPMILGADKKKLSKRHGSVAASAYRQEGYLPEALLNFLVRLGWSHGDQEEFTIDEMIQAFDFDHAQKSSAVFNFEKLQWLNGAHIRKATPERLRGILLEDFSSAFSSEGAKRLNSSIALKLVLFVQQKVKTLKEMAEMLAPVLNPELATPDLAALKWNKDPKLKESSMAAIRAAVGEWRGIVKPGARGEWGGGTSLLESGYDHTQVDQCLRRLGESVGVKVGDLVQPMRVFLTGQYQGASLFELLAVLPFDLIEARLSQAN